MQPSLPASQENSKDSPFGAMIPPTSTIPGSFIPSAMPGAGIFKPVGLQHQQSCTDKTPQSAETMETASEITIHGKWVYKNILHNVSTSHIQLVNHMLLYFSVENLAAIHDLCVIF